MVLKFITSLKRTLRSRSRRDLFLSVPMWLSHKGVVCYQTLIHHQRKDVTYLTSGVVWDNVWVEMDEGNNWKSGTKTRLVDVCHPGIMDNKGKWRTPGSTGVSTESSYFLGIHISPKVNDPEEKVKSPEKWKRHLKTGVSIHKPLTVPPNDFNVKHPVKNSRYEPSELSWCTFRERFRGKGVLIIFWQKPSYLWDIKTLLS